MNPVKTDSNSNGNRTRSKPIPTNSLLPESTGTPSSELLSQSDRDEFLAMIAEMRDKLPFLRDISAEERRTLLGMGGKNRLFATKVLEVVQQDRDFLPSSFDAEKLEQDLVTYDRLAAILMSLDQLRDLIDATAISIGSEAYENALIAYRYAKASGRGASLESMKAEMSQRFARKTKKKASKKPEAAE